MLTMARGADARNAYVGTIKRLHALYRRAHWASYGVTLGGTKALSKLKRTLALVSLV